MTVHVPIMASRDEDRALRTLIVDDSVVVRTVIERILNADRRFSVTHKTNSAEHALGYLQDHEVDLILLDIELPGQSGLMALPELGRASCRERVCQYG